MRSAASGKMADSKMKNSESSMGPVVLASIIFVGLGDLYVA